MFLPMALSLPAVAGFGTVSGGIHLVCRGGYVVADRTCVDEAVFQDKWWTRCVQLATGRWRRPGPLVRGVKS